MNFSGAHMIQTIGFFPRYVAEGMTFDDTFAVISITDPEQKEANIIGTENVLRLRFMDITPEMIPEEKRIFTDMHAQKIMAFIRLMNERGVEKVFVHCEAGISRSAAVALSLYTYLDCDFKQYTQADFANPHIVATMQKLIDKPIVIPEKQKPASGIITFF